MAVDEQEDMPEVESVLSDHDGIIRLENAMEEERDITDRMRDIIEDLEVSMKDLLTWKKKVEEDGCDRCQSRERKGEYVPYIPFTGGESAKTPTGPRALKTVEKMVQMAIMSTGVPMNTVAVPTYKKERGTFSNERMTWAEKPGVGIRTDSRKWWARLAERR